MARSILVHSAGGDRPPFTRFYYALRAALRAVVPCMPLRRLDNVTTEMN